MPRSNLHAVLRLGAVAVPLAVAAGSSCVLPSYVVGDATSSSASAAGGGSTTDGPPGSGAGGATSATTGSSEVGPGGGNVGGSGIGGDVTCSGGVSGTEVTTADRPHAIAVTNTYLFWIADAVNQAYFAAQAAPDPLPLTGVDHACAMSAGIRDGQEMVVVRMTNGDIAVSFDPFDTVDTVYTPAKPKTPYGQGSCEIALAPDGEALYGFELPAGGGDYQVTRYDLTAPGSHQLLQPTGAPVAINADNPDFVAWIDGNVGTGTFHFLDTSNDSAVEGAPTVATDVCAFGTSKNFGFTQPGEDIIFYSDPSSLALNLYAPRSASRIACNKAVHAWIVPGTDGCARIESNGRVHEAVTTLGSEQPHACSLAVVPGGTDVYWTTCQPSGGIYHSGG